MAIVTIDIDLTKTAFAVHDVDEAGKPVLVLPDAPCGKHVCWKGVRLD